MNRRRFITTGALATTGVLLSKYTWAVKSNSSFPVVRIAPGKRRFTSKAVEKLVAEINGNIGNRELAWMFGNCFPNTLDTTVDFEMINGKPDTYVITGDIDAMWLRDSSAQVWPYLPLCRQDHDLQLLIQGVINRQVKCILKDPYANAFYKDEHKISGWKNDDTRMQPGIHERKWEVDSLCYPIRLAHGYWKETGDTAPFDDQWAQAMKLVVQTFTEQQRWDSKGPYSFMRETKYATDSVPLNGYGYPVRPNGLICSAFRPSDDATMFPYLIPANFFALQSLSQLTSLITAAQQPFDTGSINTLIKQIRAGLENEASVKHEIFGDIYAYEVNGYGSCNLMDDANVPSLLSLAYLVPHMATHATYHKTRKFALSSGNPFFFKGKAGEGIGGPHAGMDQVWHLGIIMRGLTSTDDAEIRLCLDMLQQTHAGTGFMHESFHKDDAAKFSRPWFAWANTLFGELVWKVYRERPHLLNT